MKSKNFKVTGFLLMLTMLCTMFPINGIKAFAEEPKDLKNADIAIVGEYTYTGSEIIPEVNVKMNEEVLVKGRDYEISSENNIDAGEATAIITGIGQYKGKKELKFMIKKAVRSDVPEKPGLFCLTNDGFTIDMIYGIEYFVYDEEDKPVEGSIPEKGAYYKEMRLNYQDEVKYKVYARYKENKNFLPSEKSEALNVTMKSCSENAQQLPQPTNITFDGGTLEFYYEQSGEFHPENYDCWSSVDINNNVTGVTYTMNDAGSQLIGQERKFSVSPEVIDSNATYTFEITMHDPEEDPSTLTGGVYNPSEKVICEYIFEIPNDKVLPPEEIHWAVRDGKIFLTAKPNVKNEGKLSPNNKYEHEIYKNGKIWKKWYYTGQDEYNIQQSFDTGQFFTFRTRCISGDIRRWWHSDWSEISSPLDIDLDDAIISLITTLESELKSGKINSQEAWHRMKHLKKNDLMTTVQANVELWDSIAYIEEVYLKDNDIKNEVEIDQEVKHIFEGQASIIGAGFSSQGRSFKLKIQEAKDQVTVPSKYRKYFQVNIELEGVPSQSKLEMPIRITVPVPKGISVYNMDILHYEDSEGVMFSPVLFDYNKEEGTISFTLEHLSEFVFADRQKGKPVQGQGGISGFYVTFNTNGGSIIPKEYIEYGKIIDLLKYKPEKEGYEFEGWYRDKALTEKTDSVKVINDVEVYAKWTIKEEEPKFVDVTITDWFVKDVSYAYKKGIMKGVSDKKFEPRKLMNRGMLASIIYRLEGAFDAEYSNDLKDIKKGSYYEQAVGWAYKNDLMRGYGNDLFGPEDQLSREQLVSVLYRYAGYKNYDTKVMENLIKFKDADKVAPYALNPFKWAVEHEIIKGTEKDMLNPKAKIDRAQMAAIIHRFEVKFDK